MEPPAFPRREVWTSASPYTLWIVLVVALPALTADGHALASAGLTSDRLVMRTRRHEGTYEVREPRPRDCSSRQLGARLSGAELAAAAIGYAAESSLQHHLGMTCDPVAGFVQVPCIERCAFGAVKAWTGFMIASNEIPIDRRVDFDTTVNAMALTAREMNSKYKETSEGGLAVSVVLC